MNLPFETLIALNLSKHIEEVVAKYKGAQIGKEVLSQRTVAFGITRLIERHRTVSPSDLEQVAFTCLFVILLFSSL